nr:glycosyltransferase [Alloalcanivorax marinus]
MLVITGLSVGGAERQVVGMADFFSRKGHEVRLLYFQGAALMLPRSPEIKIESINLRKNIFSFVAAIPRIIKIINEFEPDVINTHLFHANVVFRVLRIFHKMPVLISSAHNSNEGGVVRRFLYRATDSLCDVSTNVSLSAVRYFEKNRLVKNGAMRVMFNGIDEDAFYFDEAVRRRVRESFLFSDDDRVVLAVGRLHKAKDYPNLLRAFSLSKQKLGSMFLIIVGDGEEKEVIIDLAVELGISEAVIILGSRNDVPDLMNACDVFVLSSASEGFGLVLAEAMACKRVVVSTDCGGAREVMGETGFVVPPSNSAALATAICRALTVPERERSRMGELARDRVKNYYSMSASGDAWISLYDAAFKGKKIR